MAVRELYADVTGTTRVENITISSSHSASVTTAVINAIDTDLDIGDEITIDLGYVDDHAQIFTGYVKNVNRTVPNNVYQVTAMDKLIRAVDYFVVSSSPDKPYNFGKGVSAESLVNNVLALCGLSLPLGDPTYVTPTNFSFGVSNDVEVNLVSAFDYCRMIADVVTWSLWADQYGNLYFKNRKPFLMGSEDFGQIGWVEDIPVNLSDPLTDSKILTFSYKRDEKDLRNKVTVFGSAGVTFTASNNQSWDDLYNSGAGGYITVLPADFYKTIVASYVFIDSASVAQQTAEYNMGLHNRIKNSLSVSCEGDYRFLARKAVRLQENITGIPLSNWYILGAEHTFSKEGYITSMECVR
jgi:hypothetical protein